MPPDNHRGGPAGQPGDGTDRPAGQPGGGLGSLLGLGGTPSGDGAGRPAGQSGMPSKTVLLAAVGVVLAGVWALSGLGVIDATMLFPEDGGDATRLVTADKLGDCREARLDTGEGCEPGGDVESVAVWWPDRNTLGVELELTEAPELGEGSEWTAELFAEAANAFAEGGLICGLTSASETDPEASSDTADPESSPDREFPPDPDSPPNADGTGSDMPPDQDSLANNGGPDPEPELIAYAAENRFTEERLGPEACDAEMRGRSVQFTIDVTGQPETDELRLIGIVRLEYPDDPARPGSDDDFLVRTSLHELR